MAEEVKDVENDNGLVQDEQYWLTQIQDEFKDSPFGLEEVEGGFLVFNGTEYLPDTYATATEGFKAVYDSLKAEKSEE